MSATPTRGLCGNLVISSKLNLIQLHPIPQTPSASWQCTGSLLACVTTWAGTPTWQSQYCTRSNWRVGGGITAPPRASRAEHSYSVEQLRQLVSQVAKVAVYNVREVAVLHPWNRLDGHQPRRRPHPAHLRRDVGGVAVQVPAWSEFQRQAVQPVWYRMGGTRQGRVRTRQVGRMGSRQRRPARMLID